MTIHNERLYKLLDVHDLTFAQFAAKLEVDPKTVERWIFTGRSPYPRTAHRAARLLGVDVFHLWPDLYARRQQASTEPVTPRVPPTVVVGVELVEAVASARVVDLWSGRVINALQIALRMSDQDFADLLTSTRTAPNTQAQGAALKQARHRKGWSQSQLVKQLRHSAARLGMAEELPYSQASLIGYISYYENGRRRVSARLWPIFAETYGDCLDQIDACAVTTITAAMVATWNTHPDTVPGPEFQRALDTVLSRAPEHALVRFALLLVRATTDTTARSTSADRVTHMRLVSAR
ncbi:MAG: hypothetical protein JWL97_3620 [Gemmatimonadales bacterium]|nr:hypothetical protein [Gemmatimonadales bacterium]